MIDRLKPYPTMKDSGVPWLGQVPEHWEVLPNRALFDEVKERDHPEEPMLSVTITRGVIRQRELLADSSKKDNSNQDKSAYKLVRPGDIAYNKMRAWQGAIGVSYYHGIVSPAYVVERPRKGTSSRYLHYLLRTPAFAKEAERWSYGITSDMWSLRPEHFKMIYGCLPSLLDQTAIIRFLDYADRRIQRYIRAKEKLIALLEEQKQAIIHQTVTGQIDVHTGQPYPANKDSDVEWLGQVPEHWRVLPLKRGFVSMEYGISDTGTDAGTIAVLTMGHVRDGKVTIPEYGGVSSVSSSLLLQDMDLLFNRTNSRDLVAKVGLFRMGTRPATFASYLVRMRSRRDNNPEFLNFLLNDVGFLAEARREAIPSLHQSNLNPSRYGRLPIPLPSAQEQGAIANFLRKRASDVNTATHQANRKIYLVREYRTRLIADVVTGRLDVRDAAAGLPEVDPLAGGDMDDPSDTDVDSALENLESRTEVII